MMDFDKIPLILYDGECGLCNSSIQWIANHSEGNSFFYAPLQGKTVHELPALKPNIDSVVVFYRSQFYYESDAAIFIAQRLNGYLRILSVLKIIPRKIRDLAYRFVAKNRIRWFGKAQSCQLPDLDRRKMYLA